MSAATQKHRLLAIGTALPDADALLLKSCSVSEQLGRLFQIELELRSIDPAIDFDKLVGSNATVRVQTPGGATRYFNGCVSRFVQTEQHENYAHYRATLVPWLWLLTRTADCRIFQKKKVPDIIEEVFKAHGFKDYELKLSGNYPEWEYCVQYRETDFNFVSRLMEQEGIYYFFTHEDGAHKVVLADAPSAHETVKDYETLIYRTRAQAEKNQIEESVTEWVIEKQVQAGVYALGDFNFKNPGAPIMVNANVSRKHEAASFEMFDYPGEFDDRGSGEAYAKVRIQELQAQHEVLSAQATVRGIAAGVKFTLKDHPRKDQNRDYLITNASCQISAGEFESSGQSAEDEFFSCNFSAIPASEHYRSPRLTPKPLIQGPQTAIIVGKKGEEIDTDEFGRVKVQFHWDRYGKVDENSSCWVRVSQPSAGKGWGAIGLPRIGQEVIVEFLEGDPDQPIITGRVYNATAKVPYPLPDNKTMTTFKSNSSKGGAGFNEFRIEDKKGSEQIFTHAEKDLDVRVKNDSKEWIGNERHLYVKKDQLENVEGDHHSLVKGDRLAKTDGDEGETVGGDRHVSIKGKDHLTVTGERSIKVDGDVNLKGGKNINEEAGQKISIKAGTTFAVEAGTAVHIKAGTTLVIEAGVQLSLKVGGNFIDIGPAGVAIKGTLVMINSGGAAGSGCGPPTAPAAPEAPDEPKKAKDAADAKAGEVDTAPEAPKPPKPVTYSDSAKVMKYAAEDGTPFCEKCEEKEDDPTSVKAK